MKIRYINDAKKYLKLAEYDRKTLVVIQMFKYIVSILFTIKLLLFAINCWLCFKKEY